MAITGGLLIGAAGLYQTHEAGKDAKDAAKKQQKLMAQQEKDSIAREDEAARKLAESTPNKSMNATKRIALERHYLNRSGGKGRSGSILNQDRNMG